MTDKVQRIREEVEKIARSINHYIPDDEGKNSEYEAGRFAMVTQIMQIIDSMQEEPVSECKIFPQPTECYSTCKDCPYSTQYKHESEELGEYINELSKQFPEVSFAKLSRIAVRVAKWQKSNLWKHADGNDLPIIDREVIALLDNGKVVFAHRPPEFWDGKNIITGKVTRNYPKTYDKGGWNIPNVKYWLDCLIPKEIEL